MATASHKNPKNETQGDSIGANGLMGSHLVDALVLRGHTVTAFDRFSSGAPTYSAEGVRMVVGDFLNFVDLSDALDLNNKSCNF